MSASAYNDKAKEYRYQYEREKLKRVPLDLQLSDYEELKQAAAASGLSVNGFVKRAIKAAIVAGADQVQAPAPGAAAGAPLPSFEGGSGAGVTVSNTREGEKQG